jgi:hypothetical protein
MAGVSRQFTDMRRQAQLPGAAHSAPTAACSTKTMPARAIQGTHLQLYGIRPEAQQGVAPLAARWRQRAAHAIHADGCWAGGQRGAQHRAQWRQRGPRAHHQRRQAGQEACGGGVGRQGGAARVRRQQLVCHLQHFREEGLPAVPRQDTKHLGQAAAVAGLGLAAGAAGGGQRGVVGGIVGPAGNAVQPPAVAASQREGELTGDEVGAGFDRLHSQRKAERRQVVGAGHCRSARGRVAAEERSPLLGRC